MTRRPLTYVLTLPDPHRPTYLGLIPHSSTPSLVYTCASAYHCPTLAEAQSLATRHQHPYLPTLQPTPCTCP